ncbi:MAG: 6-bladed beta-propeller [Mangrovibacterium sp.]
MNIKTMSFLILLIYLFSCGLCKTENDIRKIKIEPTEKTMFLSEIVDSVQFIILDEYDKAFLRNIHDIQFIGEDYLILSSDRIFCYSATGQFKWRIDAIGRGPNEYSSISDFTIDEKNKLIYIYDRKGFKILVYSEDGKLVSTKNIILLASSIAYNNDYLLLFSPTERNKRFNNKSDCGLILISKDLNFTKQLINTGSVDNVYTPNMKYFNPLDNKRCLFIPNTSDTIYIVDNKKTYPYLYLDFSYFKLSPELYNMQVSRIKKEQLASTKYCYLESPSHFVLLSLIKRKFVYTFMSKENNGFHCCQEFKNDLFAIPLDLAFAIQRNEVLFTLLTTTINENYFHSQNNSFDLLSLKRDDKVKLPNKNFNNNPILLKLFLKKSF